MNGYPVILDADGNEMAKFDADGNPTEVTYSSTLQLKVYISSMVKKL